MFARITAALRSRSCLVAIFAADAIYKALAVCYPDIYGQGFNSDEAVVGLMGLRTVEHGEFPLFFYGQLFGGGPEYLVTALTFSILPPSVVTLRLAALLLRLATDAVFYSLLRLVFADRLQRHVALVLFITMSSFAHGYLGRFSGVHLNNLFLGLAAVCLFSSGRRLLDRPVWKGLVIGMGFWVSNAILLFLLPALVAGAARQAWAGIRPRVSDLSPLALLLFFCAVGCSPRLYYLAQQPDWHAAYQGGGFTLAGWEWICARAWAFLPATLPTYLYGDLSDRVHWLCHFGVALVMLACLHSTAVTIAGFLRRAVPSLAPFCLMGCFWLTLAAFLTNREVYDQGLRYLFALQPFAAVSIALLLNPARLSSLEPAGSPAEPPGAVVTSVVLGLTLLLSGLGVWGAFSAEQRAPATAGIHEKVIEVLDEHDVRHGFADYWASYDITFRTQERIKLVPFYTDRIAAYRSAVAGATRKAYVFRVSVPKSAEYDQYYQEVLQVNVAARQQLSKRWKLDGTRVTSREVGPYLIVIEMPAEGRAGQGASNADPPE